MEGFDRKTNDVDITITAPSDNEREISDSSDEQDDDEDKYDDDNDFATSSDNSLDNSKESTKNNDNEADKNGESVQAEDEKELCDGFEDGVNLSEEKPSREEKEGESGENNEQEYEIVGDRVLVEKDGKFELVDANEIKAEYFEMLGIKAEGNEGDLSKEKTESPHKEEETSSLKSQQRPSTTPAGGNRKTTARQRSTRAQSSWGERHRNNEYSNIRSPYGLSEKQLEIKKRREEAIARRRKEEEERMQEEEKRKREEAERAFQVIERAVVFFDLMMTFK